MIKFMTLGLDGATWNLLMPLIKKGSIPTIAELVKKGTYGELETCIPPVTFPAWKCYSTGKNPGKLGVYWWLSVDIKSQKFIVNNSLSFKSKEIWDYLDKKGIKSGVIGMPTTYPPKKINGFMVSELATKDTEFTYPPEIEHELKEKFRYTCIEKNYHGMSKEEFIEDRQNLIKQRFGATRYLIRKFDLNFLNLTIFHIDNVQHFFWKYMEDNDPKYGRVIEDFWKLIDIEIRKLLEEFQPNYVFIFSDHGFTKLDAIFDINIWLVKKGYLKLKKSALLNLIYTLLSKLGLKNIVINSFRRLHTIPILGKLIPNVEDIREAWLESLIDWENSKVIALPQGLIYLNKKILKDEEYHNLRLKLKEELEQIINPINSEKLAKKVFLKEEIYAGDYLDIAPDIVILPNEGYEIYSRAGVKELWDFNPKEEGWSGTHTLHGIFIAYGPGIKKGYEIKGAKIYDLAPTILHIFGLPIPNDMDGRVLTEIFEPDSELAKKEPVYVDPSYYEKDEKEKLKSKIKELKLKGKI